jgi:hypothetical protein
MKGLTNWDNILRQCGFLKKSDSKKELKVDSDVDRSTFRSDIVLKKEISEVVVAHLISKYDISAELLLEVVERKIGKSVGGDAAPVSALVSVPVSASSAVPLCEAGEVLSLPVVLFAIEELSGLEIVTKYLHEDRGISITRIGELLNRSPKTIWNTYSIASKKSPVHFDLVKLKGDSAAIALLRDVSANRRLEDVSVPLVVISDRSLSVLESISEYLHDSLHLSFNEIACVLHRDNRTVWTVYHRAKKKRSEKAGVVQK